MPKANPWDTLRAELAEVKQKIAEYETTKAIGPYLEEFKENLARLKAQSLVGLPEAEIYAELAKITPYVRCQVGMKLYAQRLAKRS